MFNMGVEVMRPKFNFEPKCRVTMLTREEWTKGPRTSPAVKGLVWCRDGSRKQGEPGLESIDNLREEGSASV